MGSSIATSSPTTSCSTATARLGSAIWASVAAGEARGGWPDIDAASEKMGALSATVYEPDRSRAGAYDALYREYAALADYFGRGGSDVMKRLLAMKRAAGADAL